MQTGVSLYSIQKVEGEGAVHCLQPQLRCPPNNAGLSPSRAFVSGLTSGLPAAFMLASAYHADAA